MLPTNVRNCCISWRPGTVDLPSSLTVSDTVGFGAGGFRDLLVIVEVTLGDQVPVLGKPVQMVSTVNQTNSDLNILCKLNKIDSVYVNGSEFPPISLSLRHPTPEKETHRGKHNRKTGLSCLGSLRPEYTVRLRVGTPEKLRKGLWVDPSFSHVCIRTKIGVPGPGDWFGDRILLKDDM